MPPCKDAYVPDQAPLTAFKPTVVNHVARPPFAHLSAKGPDAAALAAIEQAKVESKLLTKQEALERFNRELKLRVERAGSAERAEKIRLANIRAAKAQEVAAAAEARAVLASARAGDASHPRGSEAATHLDMQRQLLRDGASRATGMMMELYEPDRIPASVRAAEEQTGRPPRGLE